MTRERTVAVPGSGPDGVHPKGPPTWCLPSCRLQVPPRHACCPRLCWHLEQSPGMLVPVVSLARDCCTAEAMWADRLGR